jgi:hypothetical protein
MDCCGLCVGPCLAAAEIKSDLSRIAGLKEAAQLVNNQSALILEIATEIAAYDPDYVTLEQSAERIVEILHAAISSRIIELEGKQ